jgi:3-dehydroquinate dehydratase-2
MLPRVLILHGPNLQLLGRRETSIYGSTTLQEINDSLQTLASELGLSLDIHQSNHEGELVELIGGAFGTISALLINPGAYTHTSVAIRDAIAAVGVWSVEVHLSNIFAREPFRRKSYISEVCAGVITGLGPLGYQLALRAAAAHVKAGNGERDRSGSGSIP